MRTGLQAHEQRQRVLQKLAAQYQLAVLQQGLGLPVRLDGTYAELKQVSRKKALLATRMY